MKRSLLGFLAAVVMLSPGIIYAADDETAAPKLTVRIVTESNTRPAARPGMLAPLYVSLGALQAYDGYSTLKGVGRGARESNVLVGGLVDKPAAFWAVKAGSTAVSIYFAERLWREHRRAEAITVMIVTNGVMAAIAARNAAVLRSPR